MMRTIIQTPAVVSKVGALVALAVALISGCAAPNPYAGNAPVVDRSSVLGGAGQPRPGAQPSNVEVTPLERPAPLAPQGGGLVLEDSPVPSGPPVVQRKPKPRPQPAANPGQSNQAVVALLDSAAGHVGNNELEKAAADLERALRIEPRNAAIWHDLGQIRLHQRRYDEAEAMASKSNSLAGGNRALQARNWRLISVARRSQGNAAAADAAEAQAVQLES